jgi:hypothetical protein
VARRAPLLLFALAFAALAQKYDGPRPGRKDIPYVLRAAQLIPTEAVTARQEGKKDARRSPNRFS